MQEGKDDITLIFLATTAGIIVLLAGFIISLIYLYQKKQIIYHHKLDALKLDHEKNLLAAQLEVQENTFQHVSREIHDNINLSLTLAKLHLNTLNWSDQQKTIWQVNNSIELLSESISKLSSVSKSLDSDIIISHGLIDALENEINRIKKPGLFTIDFDIEGDPVYMDNQKELIIFRIIQEAFNNIIRHAESTNVHITLTYSPEKLCICIEDNGKGFIFSENGTVTTKNGAGLRNMSTRTQMIKGKMSIKSEPGKGTLLKFIIPV